MPLVGFQRLVRKPVIEPESPRPANGRRLSAFVGRRQRVRALGLFLLVSMASFLVACSNLPKGTEPGNEPGPAITPVAPVTVAGQATLNLYLLTFVIAVIVFIIVEGLLVIITLRFRRKPGDDELPKQIHGSNPLEILWTIVPAITVTALFIAAFLTLNTEETIASNPAVTIDVTGFQWQWTFEYKDQGIKFTGSGRDGPVMAIPVNETVHIRSPLGGCDPLVLRSPVPLQDGRRAGPNQQVRRGRPTARHVRRPVRRVLRHRPRRHALHRAGDDAGRLRRLGHPATDSAHRGAIAAGTATGRGDGPGVSHQHHRRLQPERSDCPANQPFTVDFTNSDPAVPHNFSIHKANADGSDWLAPVNADGGQSATYNPPPLAPGDYQFFCSIHPNMVGTLHVQ